VNLVIDYRAALKSCNDDKASLRMWAAGEAVKTNQ